MSTLQKEVWTDQIAKNFYPEASFLKFAKDFSSLVEFNIINMADCGFDPDVLVNNTTYPIKIKNRQDTPLSFELDLFETENTLVRNPEAVEFAYNKMESVIYSHRMALLTKASKKAAHAFAPNQNTSNTPIITTTGVTKDNRKRLTVEDILSLKSKFDLLDISLDKRYLVLDPRHSEDLILTDIKAFKDLTDFVNGKPKRLLGFNILEYTKTPTYNATTLEKEAFGSVPNTNSTFSSFAFSSDEVMKADGDIGMYERVNDPELRGTVVGFDKRFVALPLRNKGIGAIVSTKV
ncbi:hypothetical protein PL373_11040 [Tenacibaculum maritimum]|nr:hypothetical protein [Tenacibaculum maritimum]MDB0601601.1 hypothetical protein [Tenacibaculum maritimum]MDB0601616.1 hypothetical protein [Tenacibaculum maritimum]MDB0601675.1 hypothetical protein [Tenacibaculum maritimum]MDB0612862.1 hypothetical protein [Tenacibaculum maritimum]